MATFEPCIHEKNEWLALDSNDAILGSATTLQELIKMVEKNGKDAVYTKGCRECRELTRSP